MTRTLRPCLASAAARFTAVVVLPTPPFWFATVKMRVELGRGKVVLSRRARADLALVRASAMGEPVAEALLSDSVGPFAALRALSGSATRPPYMNSTHCTRRADTSSHDVSRETFEPKTRDRNYLPSPGSTTQAAVPGPPNVSRETFRKTMAQLGAGAQQVPSRRLQSPTSVSRETFEIGCTVSSRLKVVDCHSTLASRPSITWRSRIRVPAGCSVACPSAHRNRAPIQNVSRETPPRQLDRKSLTALCYHLLAHRAFSTGAHHSTMRFNSPSLKEERVQPFGILRIEVENDPEPAASHCANSPTG